jgi:hypothetical protein
MDKIYTILLNHKNISTTRLEYGNSPMGVVFGKIEFLSIILPLQAFLLRHLFFLFSYLPRFIKYNIKNVNGGKSCY